MFPSLTPMRHQDAGYRQCGSRAVIALADAQQAEIVRKLLRRMGWTVVQARDSGDVRRLAAAAPNAVVVLGIEQPDESAWLTCAKLTMLADRPTVLMVGADTPRHRMMAREVGADALLADPVEVAAWLPPARVEARN